MSHYCEPCKREFTTKGSLVKHLETTKHKKAIDNGYIFNNMENHCEPCETQYTTKHSLMDHLKTNKHKRTLEYIEYIKNKNISMKFKVIPSCDNFIIYEDGEIFNTATKNKMNRYMNGKVVSISLKDNNNKPKTVSCRKLIYETWHDVKLTDKDKIKFRDNDKDNYHYTNLINVNGPDKHLIHMPLDETKEWNIIKGFNNYKISNYGDIFSIISNKLLINSISDGGYETIRLVKNDERPSFYVHRLVFQNFVGEIPKDKVVDHENRIRNDNYIKNLRLLTYSENSENCVRKKHKVHEIHQYTLDNEFVKKWESAEDIEYMLGFNRKLICASAFGRSKFSNGFIWKYPEHVRITNLSDLSDFKTISTNNESIYSRYKINKDGVVINKNNFILSPGKHGDYKYVSLKSDSEKYYNYLVHRLVAITYLHNDNPKHNIVNHLNENKSNCNVNNLQWTTNAENIKYSCGKKVNQICLKTGEILNIYDSVSDANVAIKKPRNSQCIYDTCNGRQNKSAGFGWEYV